MATVWTDENKSGTGIGPFYLLIDSTHYLKIDLAHKLLITPDSTLWTNQFKN